jgi:hypothetical protein
VRALGHGLPIEMGSVIPMSARSGMATIIAELRAMCNAGTADYTVAGSAYFSDDILQQELDKTQRYYRYVPLESLPVVVNSTYQYFDFGIPAELGQYIEEKTSTNWCVRDSAGGSISSALYSVNYQARRITFAADTRGTAYYLDTCAYEINAAAAGIWYKKYSFESNTGFDWSSDNHSVKRSQKADSFLKLAQHYEKLAKPNNTGISQSTVFVRTDENDSPWQPGDEHTTTHGHIGGRY